MRSDFPWRRITKPICVLGRTGSRSLRSVFSSMPTKNFSTTSPTSIPMASAKPCGVTSTTLPRPRSDGPNRAAERGERSQPSSRQNRTVWSAEPVTSQIRAVASLLPEARNPPRGSNARHVTLLEWPCGSPEGSWESTSPVGKPFDPGNWKRLISPRLFCTPKPAAARSRWPLASATGEMRHRVDRPRVAPPDPRPDRPGEGRAGGASRSQTLMILSRPAESSGEPSRSAKATPGPGRRGSQV